jgi:hypothetical protein
MSAAVLCHRDVTLSQRAELPAIHRPQDEHQHRERRGLLNSISASRAVDAGGRASALDITWRVAEAGEQVVTSCFNSIMRVRDRGGAIEADEVAFRSRR